MPNINHETLTDLAHEAMVTSLVKKEKTLEDLKDVYDEKFKPGTTDIKRWMESQTDCA